MLIFFGERVNEAIWKIDDVNLQIELFIEIINNILKVIVDFKL